MVILRESKGLQFLDVRFNLWDGKEKEEVKEGRGKVEVFC